MCVQVDLCAVFNQEVFVRQAMTAAGVDFEQFGKLMAARTYGLELSDEDRAFMAEARSKLFPKETKSVAGATPGDPNPETGATSGEGEGDALDVDGMLNQLSGMKTKIRVKEALKL